MLTFKNQQWSSKWPKKQYQKCEELNRSEAVAGDQVRKDRQRTGQRQESSSKQERRGDQDNFDLGFIFNTNTSSEFTHLPRSKKNRSISSWRPISIYYFAFVLD